MDGRLVQDSRRIQLKKHANHESERLARIRHIEIIDLLESMGAHVIGVGAALVIETTVDIASLQSGIDTHRNDGTVVAGTRNLPETKVATEIHLPKRVIAEIVM
jgi:hypothetical protein